MEMVTEGKSNKEIAAALGVTAKTVEAHRARVMDKMRAESLAELVRMALIAAGEALSPDDAQDPLGARDGGNGVTVASPSSPLRCCDLAPGDCRHLSDQREGRATAGERPQAATRGRSIQLGSRTRRVRRDPPRHHGGPCASTRASSSQCSSNRVSKAAFDRLPRVTRTRREEVQASR
jgi:hypothetical protein